MYEQKLKELETISQSAGKSPDLVQGGGGNTSVKLDEELMAVKASGYRLNQITAKDGYVIVNYKNIKNYFQNTGLNPEAGSGDAGADYIRKNIVETEGLKESRPSVEAGFHSLLKKYVIHTHPVYANILCCAGNGRELAEKIFGGKAYAFLWIPYVNPGYGLAVRIQESIGRCVKNSGRFPEVIFMENHGLVINNDDSSRCMDLNDEVNNGIKGYFSIKESYPEIKLNKINETMFESNTGYLVNYFKNNPVDTEYFDKDIIYPDQLVYLKGNISIDGTDGKLNIDTSTGRLVYKTNCREALTIEEVLLAYLYIRNAIKKNNLTLKMLETGETDFINNWESEKYRKSLLKNP